MAELDRELIALGRALEFPPTPELARAARTRLAAGPQRGWPWRRVAVIAFAAAAVAIGAAFAVPQARTAILRWIGLSGVRIRRVDALPETPANGKLLLGRRTTLQRVRRAVEYRLLVPSRAPRPDAVYLRAYPPGGAVSFVYGRPERPRLLMMQFQGQAGPFIEKLTSKGTSVERVSVDGAPGYWLNGRPHTFNFLDKFGQAEEESLRLAGNTLLWERGKRTLRLEGKLTKAEALAIARSAR